MENAGKVLSSEKLLNDVWCYEGGEARTFDITVTLSFKGLIVEDTGIGIAEENIDKVFLDSLLSINRIMAKTAVLGWDLPLQKRYVKSRVGT